MFGKGAQDGCFNEKTEGKKSHDTVSLNLKFAHDCTYVVVYYNMGWRGDLIFILFKYL
jgi:hypothetical protein